MQFSDKLRRIIIYICGEKTQIVCLAETKLSENIKTNIENNNSYNLLRNDRKGKKGGDNDKIYK